MDPNVRRLRERFAQSLLSEQPKSVLDIGCGEGHLLRVLQEAGVRCVGVERDLDTVKRLASSGLVAEQAAADDLPFEDLSFDWAVMRHVLHHLPDPAAAMREALRVSKKGVLVAEPCFDPTDPAHRLAERADRWLKTWHRRAGRVHEPNLGLEAICALIPEDVSTQVTHKIFFAETARCLADFETQVDEAFAATAIDAQGLAARAEFSLELTRQGLVYNGSLIVRLALL